MYAKRVCTSGVAILSLGLAVGCTAPVPLDYDDGLGTPAAVRSTQTESSKLPSNAGDSAVMLSVVSPASALQNATSTTITVAGGGFAASAVVRFDGQVVASQRQSENSLTATLTSANLSRKGTFPVVVSVGGVDSNPIMFAVTGVDASVRINSISPSHVLQYSDVTTVSLQGAGFTQGATVSFNGTPLATTFNSGSTLTATIPSASLSKSGTFPITVTTSDSPSVPFSFTVDSRIRPTYTSHDLPWAYVGDPPMDMTVRGTAYDSTTRVAVYSPAVTAGQALTPSVSSSSQVFVTVPSRHFSIPGTVTVKVYNLLPSGTGYYALKEGTIQVR